jgi:hypothetical protein
MRGEPLVEVLYEIRKFIDSHPSEFLFVTFQEERENALNPFAKRFLQMMIFWMFQDVSVKFEDMQSWFKIDEVTIGDYQDNKKNIFICFNGRIGFANGFCPMERVSEKEIKQKTEKKNVKLNTIGIHLKYDFYIDKWFNTDDPEKLLKEIDDHCKSFKDSTSKMLISQFVLTIPSNAKKLMKQVFFDYIPTLGNINRDLNRDDRQIKFIEKGINENKFNIGTKIYFQKFCFYKINLIYEY